MEECDRIANKRKMDSYSWESASASTSASASASASTSTRQHQTKTKTKIGADSFSKLDKEVDGVMADELLKLSFSDRNTINEEIHGVRSLAVEETPHLIAGALRAFQIELEQVLPNSQKLAYVSILAYREHQEKLHQLHQQLDQQQRHQLDQQQQQQQQQQQHQQQQHRFPNDPTSLPATQNPSPPKGIYAAYIDTNNFRLRFLRSCLFDVKSAVKRFANYLNFIQTYWGHAYLARPIQISDLNAYELKRLKSGDAQLLPFRDRKGRRVIVLLGNGLGLSDIASTKAMFYLLDCATRDSIESQRNGVVIIIDGARWKGLDKGDKGAESKKQLLQIIREQSTSPFTPFIVLFCSLPSRFVNVHVCWPDSTVLRTISNFFVMRSRLFKKSNSDSALDLNRIKFHVGEETEMRYTIKSYGIPIELLPLTGTNSVKLNYHNLWIKTRKLVETHQNQSRFDEYNPTYCTRTHNSLYNYEHECGFVVNKDNGEVVTIVECPCSNDVVFRNGTQSKEHPGNAIFRNSILSYWEQRERLRISSTDFSNAYGDGDKSDNENRDREFRERLVKDIEIVQKGRFLEWDKVLGVWVQMKDKTRINRKVAMVFYNCTKRRYNTALSKKLPSEKKRRGKTGVTTSSSASMSSSSNSSSANSNPVRDGVTMSSSSSSSVAYRFIDERRNLPSKSMNGGEQGCFPGQCDGADEYDETSPKRSCVQWPFLLSPISSPPNHNAVFPM